MLLILKKHNLQMYFVTQIVYLFIETSLTGVLIADKSALV